MEALSRLRSSPEYPAFEHAVQRLYEIKVQELRNCVDWPTYKEVLGALRTYEELFGLIDTLMKASDQLDQHRAAERERTARAQRVASAQRIASPWYKPDSAAHTG